MYKKKVKLINHDCLPILIIIIMVIFKCYFSGELIALLLYIMLYIMLAYIMLFAALSNASFFLFIYANDFYLHALSWSIVTKFVYFMC